MQFDQLTAPGQQLYKQRVNQLRAEIAEQLLIPRAVDNQALTGKRLATLMAAMAPKISRMEKMAIGALEAMANADRLKQMEEEKAQMEEEKAQMEQEKAQMEQQLADAQEKAARNAELEQLLRQQLHAAEEKDAELQTLREQLQQQEIEHGKRFVDSVPRAFSLFSPRGLLR
jgi:predicted ribosome quality control (RQC) complex YloA/Tae2 family protein